MGVIEQAAKLLRQGGVVIYPTETLYGLGALARRREAVARLAGVKGRKPDKPLPLILGDMGQLGMVSEHPGEDVLALARAFWPGPLSVLIQSDPEYSVLVRDGRGFSSVRVTSHPTAARLCLMAGGPLVATSANFAGGPNAARPDELDPALASLVDAALTDKPWPGGGAPSTVVEVAAPGTVRILRAGAVSAEALQAAGFQVERSRSEKI
ncbi:MAG: L-threonylcarbamoyladenylate synthase [Desulfovibrionales bacterium]|nr:L-threonylcarbamoyladenylate synthase [Desulfovibrionales bacterium]